jgi:hypothetical protein
MECHWDNAEIGAFLSAGESLLFLTRFNNERLCRFPPLITAEIYQ